MLRIKPHGNPHLLYLNPIGPTFPPCPKIWSHSWGVADCPKGRGPIAETEGPIKLSMNALAEELSWNQRSKQIGLEVREG